MTDIRKVILDHIIEDLEGTSQNLDIVAESWGLQFPNEEDLEYIYENIFQCDDCGIWTDLYYQHSGFFGQICDDCYYEEIEEE